MDLPKKKRCRFCRRAFRPDHRQRSRQRACSAAACQRKRRAETQAKWRAKNPDYFTSYRLTQRSVQERAAQRGESDAAGDVVRQPAPLRVPAVFRRIPWDQAQAEIGVAATDFLALVALILWRSRKTHEEEKSLVSSVVTDQVTTGAAKDSRTVEKSLFMDI